MKLRSISLFRLLLVIVICCSTIGIACADSTVPWLTGDIAVSAFDSWWPFGVSIGQTVGIIGLQVPTNLGEMSCWPIPAQGSCTFSTDGRLDGRYLDMNVQKDGKEYDFYGTTTGTYSGTGTIACSEAWPGDECSQYVLTYQESDVFSFAGKCSVSGYPIYWGSVGELSGWSAIDCGSSCNWNYGLEGTVVTTTPEPGSMVLVGSGILGLAGVLRRKLLR